MLSPCALIALRPYNQFPFFFSYLYKQFEKTRPKEREERPTQGVVFEFVRCAKPTVSQFWICTATVNLVWVQCTPAWCPFCACLPQVEKQCRRNCCVQSSKSLKSWTRVTGRPSIHGLPCRSPWAPLPRWRNWNTVAAYCVYPQGTMGSSSQPRLPCQWQAVFSGSSWKLSRWQPATYKDLTIPPPR